jgi:hypothetical protein
MTRINGNFNSKAIGVSADQYERIECNDGDYVLPEELAKGVVQMGKELIELAAANKIDLVKLGFDLTGDEKITPEKVGSALCALSFDSTIVSGLDYAQQAKSIESIFHNSFVFQDQDPLRPGQREIAKQVWGDNFAGSQVPSKQQFLKTVTENNLLPRARC